MKTYIYRGISVLVTLALVIGLLQGMGHLLDARSAEAGFNAVKAFEQCEENSIDVMVFGSSRAWRGCDTRVMYDKYGISAYNYGCHWQAINTIYLFLQDALRTQNPKVVFIEVGFAELFLEDTEMEGQIYYTRPMKFTKGKWEYLKQCFGNNPVRYAAYAFPIIMFHDRWNQLEEESFSFGGYEEYVENRGFNAYTEATPFEPMDYYSMEQYEYDQNTIDTFDKIVNLCRENDIEVIFYTTPVASEYHYGETTEMYTAINDVPFLNLYRDYEAINLDWSQDFYDFGHLNESGAGKVAEYLAEYILENGLLE